MKGKIKKIILRLTGKAGYLKKSISCKDKWYGSDYGGFYICPELINKKSIIYSFGIGEDISFDMALINHHNCYVFGFDPTPRSINWIKSQNLPENFHFYGYGISNKSGFMDFYLPKNPEHVSGSIVVQNHLDRKEKITVKMKTFEDISLELGHKHIDILKMDIEGAEYKVIESILKSNVTITQILIEFHYRFVEDGKQRTKEVIRKLKEYGYKIFAVSDSLEEISFINENAL